MTNIELLHYTEGCMVARTEHDREFSFEISCDNCQYFEDGFDSVDEADEAATHHYQETHGYLKEDEEDE